MPSLAASTITESSLMVGMVSFCALAVYPMHAITIAMHRLIAFRVLEKKFNFIKIRVSKNLYFFWLEPYKWWFGEVQLKFTFFQVLIVSFHLQKPGGSWNYENERTLYFHIGLSL